jgi:hypothetical protein
MRLLMSHSVIEEWHRGVQYCTVVVYSILRDHRSSIVCKCQRRGRRYTRVTYNTVWSDDLMIASSHRGIATVVLDIGHCRAQQHETRRFWGSRLSF